MELTNNKSIVIFDCDGVMFDSRRANINYYNHLLEYFGLPPMNEEDIAYVHMHTADLSIRHIFRNSPYLEEALKYRYRLDYTPFLKDMVMEPGLKELLACLRPTHKLAVATNRSNTIGDVLDVNGLRGYFDKVVSSLDVLNPKPHPECLLKILEFFALPAASAIYVGDSEIDLESARGAGVDFVAYKNPVLDADYHVDHLLGILDIAGVNAAGSPCASKP